MVNGFRVSPARLEKTFLPNDFLVYTDFFATPNLDDFEKANSTEAQLYVLCICVVMHSPRHETITLADGTETTIRVNSCTHWAVLGPTDEYGTKNDHVFHPTALHPMISYHEKELKMKRNITLSHVWVHTDNCSCQYKCRYVFYDVAAWAERHRGVTCIQTYAPVYAFKSIHDGVNKVIKSFIEKILTGTLSFHSVVLYSNHFPFVAGGETRRPASNGSCCLS
jgi:hypothetical protein